MLNGISKMVVMLQVPARVLHKSNKWGYPTSFLALLMASGVVDDDTVKTQFQIFFFLSHMQQPI